MKPENLQFLEENRSLWTTLRDAQYLRFPHQGIKDRLVEIMREEFRPGYTADLWCPTCVANMVREVYQAFEAWEAAQSVIQEVLVDPVVPGPKPGIPNEQPLKVKANFPKHNRRR